jgi:hypothetical protein
MPTKVAPNAFFPEHVSGPFNDPVRGQKGIRTMLTHAKLENNPHEFLRLLHVCIEMRIPTGDTFSTFESHHSSWYSSAVGCLALLVGSLKNTPAPDDEFYGKYTGIVDALGVEILKAMVTLGARLHIPDMYGDTPIEAAGVDDRAAWKRENNEAFMRVLTSLSITPLVYVLDIKKSALWRKRQARTPFYL